ncbi:MAG: phosphatidate cytidylyltransferase, partial [Alphaproteobacteria bacterium]|nr:phosphatidate cytidylyltransferase [Alphaproteobacteria bacterium]
MLFPPALQRFNTANLRLRVMSAAFMAPIVLVAVYLGGIAFGAVTTCAMCIGLYEWIRLIAPEVRDRTTAIACLMLLLFMATGIFVSTTHGVVLAALFYLALFVYASRDHKEKAARIAFGIPYMGGSGLALLALRSTPDSGRSLLIF